MRSVVKRNEVNEGDLTFNLKVQGECGSENANVSPCNDISTTASKGRMREYICDKYRKAAITINFLGELYAKKKGKPRRLS